MRTLVGRSALCSLLLLLLSAQTFPRPHSVNVTILVDTSGCLRGPDLTWTRQLPGGLLRNLPGGSTGEVFLFAAHTTLVAGRTSSADELDRRLSSLVIPTSREPADLPLVLRETAIHLGETNDKHSLVLLVTASHNKIDPDLDNSISFFATIGIHIVTIGVGSGDQSLLKHVATKTGGEYFPFEEASALGIADTLARLARVASPGENQAKDGSPGPESPSTKGGRYSTNSEEIAIALSVLSFSALLIVAISMRRPRRSRRTADLRARPPGKSGSYPSLPAAGAAIRGLPTIRIPQAAAKSTTKAPIVPTVLNNHQADSDATHSELPGTEGEPPSSYRQLVVTTPPAYSIAHDSAGNFEHNYLPGAGSVDAQFSYAGSLTILSGKGEGNVFQLDQGSPTVLGRSKTAHVFVRDPLVAVDHCRIFPIGGSFFISIIAECHEIFVGAERITTKILSDGDMIRVGKTVILFSQALRRQEDQDLDKRK